MRKAFSQGFQEWSDVGKGVQKIYELTQLADPPLHLPLGLDSVRFVREYISELSREVEQYAPWSDDIPFGGH